MLDQTFDKLKNIHNLSELRLPMLFFGLALWVAVPIIGIFPILLSIQLDLLKPRRKKPQLISLNNWLLILVILSIAIYASSFHVFADTKVYLDIYRNLDTKGIFDNYIVEDRYEFVLFLFLYPINILTDASEYWCLLIYALFVNSIVVFYLSKNFSAKYYPSILIILFSTFFYYSQIFYMRQFFSIMFVLMAMVCLESNLPQFILWSFLAIFSHLTSAVYIAVFLAVKAIYFIIRKFKIRLQKKDKMLLYLALGLLIILLIYFGFKIYNNPQEAYGYIRNFLDILPEKRLAGTIQSRVENNDGRDTDLFQFTIFRAIAIMTVGIFIIVRGFKKLSPKLLSLNLFYVMSLFQIAFILLTGFNQRIAFLFLAFYGLFFTIGLDDQSKIKPFGMVSLLTIFAAASNTFNFLTIQNTMIDSGGWSFFDGQPLAMSLFDYIWYFFQSI